ncbi:DUF1819 family protein [Paenibacillus antibioticophila]|uniref:DUF1819 family protein n=1 Tax=Paenibacillus antibioticophila TaxID=1274374 RepID=UPI001BB2F60B|nr:DUF1819 family protein [Paenibacillus antibioticophila]
MKRIAEYSAGTVKQSFWFSEFRKVVHLLDQEMTITDIKALNKEQNIFAAPTQERATQIMNTIATRVASLDASIYPLFEQSDVSTQKLIALVAIMQTDRLFFEFVYEVVREKMIVGSHELTDSDIRIFFKEKQLQSDKVATWTEYTLKRLGRCYKTMLMEAGLTDRTPGSREILKPIMDPELEAWLQKHGMDLMIHALTGVR